MKAIIGVVALAIGVGPTLAADLPVRTYTKAPAVVAPAAYDWTGFYIGAIAGGAWGSFDPTTTSVNNGTYFLPTDVTQISGAGAQSIKPNGFTGGFELGYNWQSGNIVFGLEADIQSFRLSGSATSGSVSYISAPGATFMVNSNASTNWLATTRGRIGFAANNWLLFATGGAAFTSLNGNFSFTDTFAPASELVSFSNNRTGYTVGAGVELGLGGQWSAKAEYLYVDFGAVSATGFLTNAPTQPLYHSADLKANIARLGINYRFGGPVVAKY
jgi:outer membrane immunogenic protein